MDIFWTIIEAIWRGIFAFCMFTMTMMFAAVIIIVIVEAVKSIKRTKEDK